MLVFLKKFAYTLNEWSLAGSTKEKITYFVQYVETWFILEKIFTRHLNNLKFSLFGFNKFSNIWDTSRDSVTFAQSEKREKQSWRSVTFSKVRGWSL